MRALRHNMTGCAGGRDVPAPFLSVFVRTEHALVSDLKNSSSGERASARNLQYFFSFRPVLGLKEKKYR